MERLADLTQSYELRTRANTLVSLACCRAISGSDGGALDMYEARHPRGPHNATIQKAAVAGMTSDSGLTALAPLSTAFVETIAPFSAFERLPARRVPLNVSIAAFASSASAGFVGEGRPIPVVALSAARVTLPPYVLGLIAVYSKELARSADPAATAAIARDLARLVGEAQDRLAFNPDLSPIAHTSPGSLTYGAYEVTSTGATADAIEADVAAALAAVSGGRPSRPYVVVGTTAARDLARLRTTGGTPVFPNLKLEGPADIWGVPVLVSAGVGSYVVAIDADAVLKADGGLVLDTAESASIELDDSPTASTGTGSPIAPVATHSIGLWQTDSIGLRARRYLSWTRARQDAVAFLGIGGSPLGV